MADSARLITREYSIELLIDASFWDVAAMERGFVQRYERHVSNWREQEYHEFWIRQPITTVKVNCALHRTCKAQGFSTTATLGERMLDGKASQAKLFIKPLLWK